MTNKNTNMGKRQGFKLVFFEHDLRALLSYWKLSDLDHARIKILGLKSFKVKCNQWGEIETIYGFKHTQPNQGEKAFKVI